MPLILSHSEEIYMKLRAALLDRMHDREVPVRVQAAIALSKLSGSEESSEIAEGEKTVAEVLLDTLAHDPSPYVHLLSIYSYPDLLQRCAPCRPS
jgi:Chromosome condensation complex Condensin, subunit G